MTIKALFRRKEPELDLMECVFNRVVELSDSEFEYFRKNLLRDYDFIRANQDEMGAREGVTHCILVIGAHSEDGILVNSEGASYARYVAHFPGASAYLQQQQWEQAGAFDEEENDVLEPEQWSDEDYDKMTFGGLL